MLQTIIFFLKSLLITSSFHAKGICISIHFPCFIVLVSFEILCVMGFDHRKILLMDVDNHKKSFCSLLPHIRPPCPPPPPPPSPLLPHRGGGEVSMKELATLGMTILACVIAGVLLLGILCAIVRAYHLRRRSRENRRIPPIFFGTQEDFLDEDHGPEVDHPIWYINTVGLPQSVIDSISVFLYKKGEGLIDGTECSVCLNEFQEDERLRLLPKCSHAFHIACIDAWLRSHKNCPLCRAPTVIDLVVAQTNELQPSSSGVLNPRNENLGENLGSYSGEVSASVGENGASEIITNGNGIESNATLPVEDVSASENSGKFLPRLNTRNGDSDSRVLSDLADNRRVIEEDLEPVRRSVSMDSSSASKIYIAVANVVNDKSQVNLDIVQQVHRKNLKAKSASKRIGGSSSIYRLINSSSNGSCLQKGPISMKRSVSSSGKSSSSRHNRRQPILPVSF